MKNDPTRKTTKKANSRKWKAQWKKIVSTLAAVTVFCTTYALILPAITVNSNTYCGLEEHEHTEACYTKELICGFEEGEAQGESGETAPETVTETVTEIVTETVIEKEIQQVLVDEGHVHQDSCYEETKTLVCGLEEIESKEAVLDEEGNVIEEAVEGHTHTDECYQVERVLVCGQEEREPVYEEQEVEVEKEVQKEVEVPVEQPAQPAQPAGEPHVHTDACYKEVLTCGKEEHKHVDECFSNPTLDLETAADWEKTLPKEDELTENWAEDVLTIAKSQLGYKESSRNFKAVNGDRKGYTRYGVRFGAPYSDWCAMFIQFAMHYAGVDERLMPGNPSVSKWIENVKKIENYFEPADYTPVPGDIMFIDWDKVVEGVERDGDHIGIVAEVKTTEETTPDGAKLEVPTSIVTIEGNLDNEVKYNTYKIDDERILGYSHMPEKPETEEELEERVKEIEALIEGKELVEGEEGAEGEEPAEGTEEESEEVVVDTIIALASYTESGVQVNFEAPSSVFPEGTVDPALNVVEILPGTPEYDEFFAQAQANAGTEVLNARFFDISVVDLEGNEIKLNDESLAKVEIVFPENETMTTEGNIDVLHFAEEGLEVLESQVQGGEEVEAITFDTTSFSPYGVVQTGSSGDESGEGSGSGSGSGSGTGTANLIPEHAKKNSEGEYVVTSWYALKELIESRKYIDTDDTEKTDAPNTMTIVIDGNIAADSAIKITNTQTITLNGINDAHIYVDNKEGVTFNNMFWVNGGTLNVEDVTFSGRKANFVAGGTTNACVDKTISDMLQRSQVSYVKSTGSTASASTYASTFTWYDPKNSSNTNLSSCEYVEFKKDGKPLRINTSTGAMEYVSPAGGRSEVRYGGNKLYATKGSTTYYINADGSLTTNSSSASSWTYSNNKLTSGNSYLALSGNSVTVETVSNTGGSPSALKIGTADGTISNVVRAHSPLEIGAKSNNFEIRIYNNVNNNGRHFPYDKDGNYAEPNNGSLTNGEYYWISTINTADPSNPVYKYLSGDISNWSVTFPDEYSGVAVGGPDGHPYLWKCENGALINKKTGKVLYYDGSNVSVKNLTDTVQGPFGCDSTVTPDTCTPVEGDYTDNSVITANTKGFFITATNGAQVNLGSNAVFQDMKYTGTQDKVSPIYVSGTNTKLDINGAEIKNNYATLPALQNDNNRKLLYNDVMDRRPANDLSWDINPGGRNFRKGHDSNKVSAGGILIENAGTVNLNSGTIGGTDDGNTGIAGAVYVNGGTLNQTGGEIKGNHALKGAVIVDGSSSTYNLNKGSLTYNDSSIYGGAISVFNEGNVTVGPDNAYQGCDDDDRPVIAYNKTLDQGGGIYVHSDNVTLNRAKIENNIAHFMGGGIYVYGGDSKQDDKNSVLLLRNTFVTDNSAGNEFFDGTIGEYGFTDSWSRAPHNYGEGGGMWLCTYGSFIMDGEEIHIWDNNAHGTAPDFYKHSGGSGSGIITEFWTDENDKYERIEGGNRTNFVHPKGSSFTPITGRLSLENNADYDNHSDNNCNSVEISGNRAGYAGGGIGSNGILSYKPLNNENVYRPELSFTKNFGAGTDTTGKSITFKVDVFYPITATEPVATYENIELSDTASAQDDANGVNATGFEVNGWKATLTLPQLFDANGQSVYKSIIENNSRSLTESDGAYNVDNQIKIVITEESMTGGSLDAYELTLGDLTYSYTLNTVANHQNDISIKYHEIKLNTALTNTEINKPGKVQLTKMDKEQVTVISDSDNQPEFRISAVNDSDELIDTVGTVIEGADGVYTTEYLDPGKYAIWESKAPNGYDGLGSDKFIYVNIAKDGTPSFVSTTGLTSHVVAGNVIASTDATKGGTLPITVYNDKHTKLTIAKVDKDGNPINSASTKFRIMTFDGTTFSKEFTLDATGETNYYEIANEDVETFFSATNLNLDNANFFLKETVPPSNRYNALDTVIPFRVRKVNGNNYQFIPMTLSQVKALTDKVTVGSDNKTITINATQDKIKFATTAANETQITGVDITSGEGSLTYQVKNELKPIEIKVAKLDENGNPLPGASFTIRHAESRGSSLSPTSNDPDDGVYTFANTAAKPNFLQTRKSYSIWEASAPDGYLALGLSVMIDIDEYGGVTLQSDTDKLNNDKLENDAPKYLLDGTADEITAAISAGIISLSEDTNGVVTISIKNYPTEDLKVEKVWDDNDNQNNTRPSAITVDLYANLGDGRGVVKVTSSDNITTTPTLTLNSGNTWSGEWQNLPSYRNGTKITYSVKESNVPDGYISNITYTPATETTTCPTTTGVFQGWQEINVADLRNATNGFRIRVGDNFYFAKEVGGELSYADISNTTYYDTNGNPKSNTLWKASDISTYHNPNNGYTYYFFKLRNVGKNSYLGANGTTLRTTSSANDRFGYVASRMYVDEKYYDSNTYTYVYRYVDGDLSTLLRTSTTGDIPTLHFEVPVYGEQQDECETVVVPAKYSITNTWKDTVDLVIEKVWSNVSASHPIPETLTVTLYRNGDEKVGDITLSAENNWKYTWTGLRKYDENNQPCVYSITEEEVDYYVLDAANSTTQISSNNIANGETVESWTDVPYYQLNSTTDGFRIIVDNYVYYLDTSGTTPTLKSAHISTNRPEFKDARSVWTLNKYVKSGSDYVMQFKSKYDTSIYIGTRNSKLIASSSPRDFHYQTSDGEMWWNNGTNDMGWFTADIANNSCRARFVQTQKANWKESGSLKLTNKYEPHAGLELVKVDENGASNQWTDEAVFTLYHMRGQIAPVTLSLSDGKHLIEEVPTSLIPEAGKTNYFFIVETTRPKQGNKEYAQLGTAIPISINSRGEVALITEASQYPTDNFFHTKYNATTKILAAAGSGTNARPAIKVDFSQIGSGKAVSSAMDDNRIVITAKNTPINNELELVKIDNSTSEGKVDGATFSIKNESTGSYVSPAEGGLWTTSDGKWKVSNLAPGTYTIKEESAPKNYVKSNATVTVVVDEYTGEITVTPSDTNVVVGVTGSGTTSVSFKFINEISSYELPEAGGIGTTILYITGAILVIGAGVLLIVRKKMNK